MASSNGNLDGVTMRGDSAGEQRLNASAKQLGIIETEFLIVGAGPAGAALACFLASHELKGIMISAAPGTAKTPRAHITNMAALECLRDIGLDEEVNKLSSKGDEHMVHTRWCHSMAGEEYARVYSWGNDPRRKTGYVTVLVRDSVSGLEYEIRTKYLFGADGARSQVVKQLGLPLLTKPGQGLAVNILVKTDLSHLVQHRKGNLHWVMQPDRDHPKFGWMGIVRMVKPWTEWMFILFPTRDCDLQLQVPKEDYLKRVRDFIGDETPAEILDISKWYINETVAERYSEGNIFCLGDAVHRHPPLNGLGSNTCIQDAFNLAWKIAYVRKGHAPASLLSSYSAERQPVGQSIITRANKAFRDHFPVWDALGMLPEELDARQRVLQELASATPEGQKRRSALQEAILHTSHEFHGLGIEMGQFYTGQGIYDADEPGPYVRPGKASYDEVLYYEPSTYPGCRLPHAWLNKSIPRKPVSTIDLAGHGMFVLFTGIGGDDWISAGNKLAVELRIPLKVYSIGFRQDWEDVYFAWAQLRGVGESGAVLVRPDRFVAWRAPEVLGSVDECKTKLREVMRAVLGH